MRFNPITRTAAVAAICLALNGIAGIAIAQEPPRPAFAIATSLTDRATVVSVDMNTRAVELTLANGSRTRVVAHESVRNLGTVRPGDVVLATYDEVVAFIVLAPGARPPADTMVTAKGRAEPGQLPAAAAGERRTVTRRVVGVDLATNTISLVDPRGGQVLSHRLVDPERQQDLRRVKVGDTVTGTLIRVVAVSIERAR